MPAARPPACALASDQHLPGVEAELDGMREEPLEPGEAVLDRNRIRELGCQPVLHGCSDDVVLEHPLDEHRQYRPSAAADHAAAVQEKDARR